METAYHRVRFIVSETLGISSSIFPMHQLAAGRYLYAGPPPKFRFAVDYPLQVLEYSIGNPGKLFREGATRVGMRASIEIRKYNALKIAHRRRSILGVRQ